MIGIGEDELTCDLAETYHILNWRELPPSLVATLSVGLRDDSRIKKKISGHKLSLDQMLMCFGLDVLQYNLWIKTKDGAKGRNKPESILAKLSEDKKKEELAKFADASDFDAWYQSKMR